MSHEGLADRAGERLRTYQARELSADLSPFDAQGLVSGARERGQRRRLRRMRLAVAASAVSVALLAGWVNLSSSQDAMSPAFYSVNELEPTGDVNQIVYAGNGASELRFSGAEVTLGEGGSLLVEELRAPGAAIRLQQGTLDCRVDPVAQGSWAVRAGAYVVRVVGTVFAVVWEPESGHFETNVTRGIVDVTGPGIEGVRRLEAGASLVIEGRPQVAELPPEVEAVDTAQGPEDTRVPEKKGREAPDAPATKGWRELARDGKFSESMAAVHAAGYERTVSMLSAAELLKLADVARMAGESGRASALLHQVRSRSAGSSSAAIAAYSLGTTAFDQQGNYSAAAGWFQTYLAEAPSGPLAREALGRLMEAQHRAGNRAQARQAAEKYQRLYPQGLHGPLAKRILRIEAKPE